MAKGNQKHQNRKNHDKGARKRHAAARQVVGRQAAGLAFGAGRRAAERVPEGAPSGAEQHTARVAPDGAEGCEDSVLRCPHASKCGACQHVDEPYEQQLKRKDQAIAHLFRGFEQAELLPILGMEHPYYYRNKVISPYAPGKLIRGASGKSAGHRTDGRGNGRGKAGKATRQGNATSRREILCGMYAAGTHRIVPTDECLVENAQAKRAILTVRSLMPKFGIAPYNEDTGEGFLRHAVVRVGHTSGEMLVTLVTNGQEFPASRAFCRELVRRCPFVTTVVQNINERQTNVILGEHERTLYGPGFILDKLCGLSFRISSQSFYQVNAVQTEVLYRTAVEMAGFSGGERVLDAYCGTGTIGLVAASQGAGQVVGVDTVESAIRDARLNARHNGVENAQFVAADATQFILETAAAGERFDVVMMDPPRAGSTPEFLDAVAAMQPRKVVYISCNPQTQVRDCEHLQQRGYRLRTVQPVDMFPHTEHIETVALLTQE